VMRHFGAVRSVVLACCLHLPIDLICVISVLCIGDVMVVRLPRRSNQRLDLLLRAFYVCSFMFIFDIFVLPVCVTARRANKAWKQFILCQCVTAVNTA